MRYAGIIDNDLTGGPGLSVTVFVQGCPHRCSGCYNEHTWDFNGGFEVYENFIKDILNKLNKNNINRRLCIMGGEPLCKENISLTHTIVKEVRKKSPNTEIAIWTGYCYENLIEEARQVLKDVDVLVDGPFILEQKDLTLAMRGSRNQRIIDIQKTLKSNSIVLKKEYYEI